MPRQTVRGMLRVKRDRLRNSALERMREAWVVKAKSEKQPRVIEQTQPRTTFLTQARLPATLGLFLALVCSPKQGTHNDEKHIRTYEQREIHTPNPKARTFAAEWSSGWVRIVLKALVLSAGHCSGPRWKTTVGDPWVAPSEFYRKSECHADPADH